MPAEQECDCQLLVRHPIQGAILAVGAVGRQLVALIDGHLFGGRNHCGACLLLPQVCLSARVEWTVPARDTANYVSVF